MLSFSISKLKTEKIDKPADKNIHNLGYEKLSLKKYSAVSSYKTGNYK